jgi:four helix bundle protein
MSIAYKEAREYWIRLIRDTRLIESEETPRLLDDVEEIIKILFTIVKNFDPNK